MRLICPRLLSHGFVSFVGLLCLLVLCDISSASSFNSGTAMVEKIIDGDTIRVKYKSESIKVRLWGIDTPEYHQPFSKVAKKFTSSLVAGKQVSLQIMDWDDYGRMVAIVTLSDKRSVNEELLKKGLAWVHIYYCKKPICDKWYGYEKKAQTERIGLWYDKSPVPPWVWKRRKRTN